MSVFFGHDISKWLMLITYSAFWGQSFVAELTRISEHGEKKIRMRQHSAVNTSNADDPLSDSSPI